MTGLAGRVEELRRAFDRSFAEPVDRGTGRAAHALAIRVGGLRYAVRLSGVAAVNTGWTVLPLPGSRPELLGLAGYRHELVPVYDLAALLGVSVSTASRWTVLAAGTDPVAFAFEGLDGHLPVPPDTGPVVRAAGASWTMIDLADLVAAIQPDTGGGPP